MDKSADKSGHKIKHRGMALDLVEPGNDETDSHGKSERVSKYLPPEVTSKMMYNDVFNIAWPSIIELTLTQLTSMVDMMMVGRLGPYAIAAIGLTNQPKFLMMTVFMAMNVGATALVARHKGADERHKANIILKQALILTFFLSIISSIVGYINAEWLVKFMGAADSMTLAGGTQYFKIQMTGFLFMALTSTMTATLRGVGNSRIAMMYNLTANVVNVVLNFLLIEGRFGFPRMELAGASLATIIAQFVAFCLALSVVLRGRNYLHISLKDGFKPQIKYMKNIFQIGIPAMIEQLIMRAGMITYSKTVATLGTTAFATHQICLNILSISFMNGQAFAVSATSLMGQSLGKKRPDMAQAYTSRTRRLGMIVSIFIGLMFFLFASSITSLYTDDRQVIEQGARILTFVAFIQPFQSSQFILAGSLRGAGDTRATAVISLLTVLLLRPSLAVFNIHILGLGLEGAWIALICDQMLRSLLVLLRFNSGKWKRLKFG